MLRLGRPVLQLGFVIAVSGCVSVTYIPTAGAHPPKAASCSIEVFSAAPPARAYNEIGILEAEGSFWQADLEHVLPRLKEEACLAGGDAIVLLSAQKVEGGGDDGGEEELVAFATVIRWDSGGQARYGVTAPESRPPQ